MQLIADSGSTKTEWIIKEGSSKQVIITSGINPFFENSSEIAAKLEKEWPAQKPLPGEIHFYGAGCANPEKNEIVASALQSFFDTSNISINSDLLGAARSLCQDKEGIACILGTGSNSCYYDGQSIVKNVSPLGFIIGDEGSGAVIGKIFISDLLKGQLPESIVKLFFKAHPYTSAEIVNRIYKLPFPNRFLASFSKFIKANIHLPELENMVINSFHAFIERNLLQYSNVKDLPIHFTGSIAFHFKPQLLKALKNAHLQLGSIEAKPMNGLLNYHASLKK